MCCIWVNGRQQNPKNLNTNLLLSHQPCILLPKGCIYSRSFSPLTRKISRSNITPHARMHAWEFVLPDTGIHKLAKLQTPICLVIWHEPLACVSKSMLLPLYCARTSWSKKGNYDSICRLPLVPSDAKPAYVATKLRVYSCRRIATLQRHKLAPKDVHIIACYHPG